MSQTSQAFLQCLSGTLLLTKLFSDEVYKHVVCLASLLSLVQGICFTFFSCSTHVLLLLLLAGQGHHLLGPDDHVHAAVECHCNV